MASSTDSRKTSIIDSSHLDSRSRSERIEVNSSNKGIFNSYRSTGKD